jgi:dTDP-4-dehydrorhamnose reductase
MGIEPIAGLLHHGSGPIYTNLLDPRFPTLFARYAQRVAARYPWLTSFTPINEPLTTARFSCAYGHWYPHCRSMRDFLQALLIQCKGGSLVVFRHGDYEPGAFDIRSVKPRRTALAGAARALANDGNFDHPVLHAPGWWQREDRYYVQRGTRCGELRKRCMPIAIFASGDLSLAELLADTCTKRGLACSVLKLEDDQPEHQICLDDAWAAVNIDARFFRRLHECAYGKPSDATIANSTRVAEACARARIPLVHFSSDLVFDGSLGRAYVEQDPAENVGCDSVAAERAVLRTCQEALVVRAGPLFGLPRESAATFEGDSRSGVTVSPTFAPDLCQAVLDLLIDGERGTWHLANDGAISPSDFAKMIPGALQAQENSSPACHRSRTFALSSSRGDIMPSLADAMARFAESRHASEGQEQPPCVAAE